MAHLTEKMLRQVKSDSTMQQKAQYYMCESKLLAEKSIFLSHSHQDRELVLGIKYYLSKAGINLYIDWQDSSMPRVTSKETAIKIKNRISELDIFMMLATENSLKSRWVPWEVGVADSVKQHERILIIPVQDDNGTFSGNEYLNIYKRIEIVDGKLIVFNPTFTYMGDTIREFLQK